MSVATKSRGYVAPIISTPSEYDDLIAECCLPADVDTIEGIDRHTRFEQLTPEEIDVLNEWTAEHARFVILEITTIEMALHVLGAREVDPGKESFNLALGTGKDKTYYWCERNQHNRIWRPSNLGTPSKEGLIYDLVNRFFGLGPVAHIDSWSWILSLQHRILAFIKAKMEAPDSQIKLSVFTLVGVPPQLAATLDRGAPKSGADQEYIDRSQFTREFLESVLEYVPEDVESLRNELAKQLVTVRNNVYSRINGTGYHPGKRQQPSTREALDLQQQFQPVGSGDALQALVARVWERSRTEDGKKAFWSNYLPPAMVSTLCVLASNRDGYDGQSISVDDATVDTILDALARASDGGEDSVSSYLREIARIKKQPKKPSGMDRWVFWGLVKVFSSILDETEAPEKAFPTDSEMKRLKKGTISYPILGGMDAGPKGDEAADNE